MQLLLDIGNSRLKWASWGPEGIIETGRLEPEVQRITRDDLRRAFGQRAAPDVIKVSNVSGNSVATEISAAMGDLWGMEVRFASSLKSGYGVTIAYERPEMLGVDRWLAMVAAHHRVPGPVLVIDCGTAVTLDAVDGRGFHLGGLIVPGTRMMWEALFSRTRMPTVEYRPHAGRLGKNTTECVAAGALQAICGLLERIHRQLSDTDAEPWTVIATGGGAGAMVEQLDIEVVMRPHLVFEGLSML
jgi:type III pantothenate kinase